MLKITGGVEMLNYVNILVFSSSPGVVDYESEIGGKNKVCQHTWCLRGIIQLLRILKNLLFFGDCKQALHDRKSKLIEQR